MQPADKQALALWLLSKRENAELVADETQLPPITNLQDVYDVHLEMTKIKSTLGAHCGWKCGACAPAPMKAFGITEPFRAPLFEAKVQRSPASSPISAANVFLEAEFAFVIGSALPPRDGAYTEDEVWAAVSHVCIAIEVCGLRWTGAALKAATGKHKLVDGGVNSLCVFGEPIAREQCRRDLDQVAIEFTVNGLVAANGTGANVLSHPVKSLTWLANDLLHAGLSTQQSQCGGGGAGLLPGDFIMSGAAAVVKNGSYKAGDVVVADFGSLGKVEVQLTQDHMTARL